jgi:NADH dehydrogenase (ubiquinone) 1 alpha subcomplex subunit 13
MPQDMPPVGGYRPVQYKRNLPARGFKPVYYLIGMGAIMTWGINKYGKGIDEYKYVFPGLHLLEKDHLLTCGCV